MDWVFGLAWCSDRHLVTGSRDQSLALWQLPDGDEGDPPVQLKQYENKQEMKRKGTVNGVQQVVLGDACSW